MSTVLVCLGSADYYFLDRVQELSHQNDRVVPILVAKRKSLTVCEYPVCCSLLISSWIKS